MNEHANPATLSAQADELEERMMNELGERIATKSVLFGLADGKIEMQSSPALRAISNSQCRNCKICTEYSEFYASCDVLASPPATGLGMALFEAMACGLPVIATGKPVGQPLGTASSVVDRYTALHATIGALAALRHRDRTGEGQLVDVCLLDFGTDHGGDFPRPIILPLERKAARAGGRRIGRRMVTW